MQWADRAALSAVVIAVCGCRAFAQPNSYRLSENWARERKGGQAFKFSPDGQVLLTLGTAGGASDGSGTFNGPTDVAAAPNADVFVTDGHINIYVADSDSNATTNPGWKRGIRMGSAKDGTVTALILDTQPNSDSNERCYPGGPPISVTSGPEGVAADAMSNVYGAEAGPRALRK